MIENVAFEGRMLIESECCRINHSSDHIADSSALPSDMLRQAQGHVVLQEQNVQVSGGQDHLFGLLKVLCCIYKRFLKSGVSSDELSRSFHQPCFLHPHPPTRLVFPQ